MPLRKKRGPLTPPRHRAARCRPLGDSTGVIIATKGRRGRPGRGHGVADDQNECEQSYKHESLHWKAVSSFLRLKSCHGMGGTAQEMGREAPLHRCSCLVGGTPQLQACHLQPGPSPPRGRPIARGMVVGVRKGSTFKHTLARTEQQEQDTVLSIKFWTSRLLTRAF